MSVVGSLNSMLISNQDENSKQLFKLAGSEVINKLGLAANF